ncbi:MAG: hypothetical protein HY600_04495 [Candidatus Omnitrophica bacterium]|nr:hypothetical protein [Candidatus Omnitrophota bacterium]
MQIRISADELKRLYWDQRQSAPQIAVRLGLSRQVIYEQMRKHQIPRRSLSESNFVASLRKPQFRLKISLTPEEEKLKVAGIMLYWAEGAQTVSGVDFTNSNPVMIQLFLRFLRQVCGVAEPRLRVYLYHHGNPDVVEASKRFWSRLTDIPLAQFSRPYIRRGNVHRSGRIMPHGLAHIRYCDKRLLQLIQRWITEYATIAVSERAGSRAAKWGGL